MLQSLVRDYYSLATSQRESGTIGFPDDAKDELRKAGGYWQRYLDGGEGRAEPGGRALRAPDLRRPAALNRPKEAQKAAAILAQDSNDVASYLRLVSYAARAGDTRTADLAAKKAVDLAPKSQRKQVKQQAEAAEEAARATAAERLTYATHP